MKGKKSSSMKKNMKVKRFPRFIALLMTAMMLITLCNLSSIVHADDELDDPGDGLGIESLIEGEEELPEDEPEGEEEQESDGEGEGLMGIMALDDELELFAASSSVVIKDCVADSEGGGIHVDNGTINLGLDDKFEGIWNPGAVVSDEAELLDAIATAAMNTEIYIDGEILLSAEILLPEGSNLKLTGISEGATLNGQGSCGILVLNNETKITLEGLSLINGKRVNGGAIHAVGTGLLMP